MSNTKPLLDDLDESNLTILLEAAADLALIVDKAGKITHVSGASTDFESEIGALLVGQQLVDTVVDDILPDLFREGQGVIAIGELAPEGHFVAHEVLAKHDENYMPPEVADSLQAAHDAGVAGNKEGVAKP